MNNSYCDIINQMAKVKFTIITLFQDALAPYLSTSMMWKATKNNIAEFSFVDLREFGLGPHKSVDDTPYGGGDGMLLRCEPVFAAIEKIKQDDPNAKVILPTPAGQIWRQSLIRQFAEKIESQEENHFIILCPHYEGYDERILTLVDYQVSLGHFVLTGGELPALIMIDSIVRLLPGVLCGESSAIIEYPQYTKPADFRGMKVPEVLLSGHHGKIKEWRESHQRPSQS